MQISHQPHKDESWKPSRRIRRIGFDLSILDRTATGTSVYARNVFAALQEHAPEDMNIIPLRAPKPFKRRNKLSKIMNFLLEQLWLMVLLPIAVRKKDLDIIHMPANIISPLVRIPQICSIHDAHFITTPEGRDRFWRIYANWYFRYAARHADLILCDTFSAKQEIIELLGADESRMTVVNLGLTRREAGTHDLDLAEKLKPFVLSVGAVTPNKNFSSLAKAFARLVHDKQIPDHKLIIAGPPARGQAELESIVESESLTDRVILAGNVTDSYLAALFQNASAFVFPSLSEGFGFPPLEAMMFGIPVAASNAPCIPETLDDAAIYFDPNSIEEISEAILRVLTDEELRQRLFQSGKERSAEFTWDKTAANTLTVYRSMMDSLS